MKEFLGKISARERVFLAAGAAFLLLVTINGLILSPFLNSLRRYEKEVPEKREQLAWMQEASREVAALGRGKVGTTGNIGDSSPLVVIEKTTRQWRLDASLKRVEPEGESGVKVWLDEAVFDDIVLWLQMLADEYGLMVTSLSADSRDAPGYVDARITLETTAP